MVSSLPTSGPSVSSVDGFVPRSAYNHAGGGAGVGAVGEDLDAVDEDVGDAGGVLVGLGEGGVVLDGGRVEDDHIGEVAGGEAAAAVELEHGGGQRGELADGLAERDDPLV